jgi:CobQ-like glutamine amidotransferase family enzyme
MKKKDSIRLCHLYPDLLNLYGDRGNILALIRRSMQRDISFEVEAVSMGDAFDPKRYDMIFLGGGQDAEQNILRSDFVTGKGEDIMRAVDMNKVFLCVCGGYQMMGRYYEEHDGHRIECLGAINIWTVGKKKRFIGDTVYSCEYLTESKLLYGFENHSGRTYLGEDVKPLAKVLIGAGNNGEDGTEGAIDKNVYCTYSHGSFLPKNPAMTDLLLQKALEVQKGAPYTLAPLASTDENFAREALPTCKNA